MAKKNETGLDEPKLAEEKGVSRRELLKSGAVAGIGAAALLDAGCTQSQGAEAAWDYDVDVVVAGGGCAGLTAAIRARDLGASMLHSGSFVSLGGGDPLQLRDMKGHGDKEGFVTSPPVEGPEELDDS